MVVLSINSTVAQASPNACLNLFRADYLTQQAAQYGLKVATFKEAFRFEGRKPSEILKAGGFTPNPAKPDGDIQEHVRSRSLGTDKFVSFTLDGDNNAILGDGFLTEASRSKTFPSRASEQRYLDKFKPENIAITKERPEEIEAELSVMYGKPWSWGEISPHRSPWYQALSAIDKARYTALDDEWLSAHKKIHLLKDGPQTPEVVEFYEYRVEKVRAIKTAKIGVVKEKEIVTDGLSADHITHVRKVYLIFYGGYMTPPSPKDPFYGQQLGLLLQDPATAPDIEFGRWRTLKQ